MSETESMKMKMARDLFERLCRGERIEIKGERPCRDGRLEEAGDRLLAVAFDMHNGQVIGFIKVWSNNSNDEIASFDITNCCVCKMGIEERLY